jgi:hypothetical protein
VLVSYLKKIGTISYRKAKFFPMLAFIKYAVARLLAL